MPEPFDLTLIPFVIAVTGHRDLRPQDLALLEVEVRSVFATMRAQVMPSRPIILLTGLAEGADQFVAEIGLKESILIAAVLPMPLGIYRKHIAHDARGKFDELLSAAFLKFQLPLDVGLSDDDIDRYDALRGDCYEALGHFLAHNSQALLALWDGTDSEKRGGTSSVVRHFLSGRSLPNSLQFGARCGVVYHIATPRMKYSNETPPIRTTVLAQDAK